MTDRRGAMGRLAIALAAVPALAAFLVRGGKAATPASESFSVRGADEADLPRMVELVEARRRLYQRFEPVFWRKAEDSAQKTLPFFRTLLDNPRATALVAEGRGGQGIVAFLIAIDTPAPPVHAPGGPTILIDDFCVADPSLWPTAGRALLDHARDIGRAKGWRQLVVVSGWRDGAKQKLLRDWKLSLASTWWTATL